MAASPIIERIELSLFEVDIPDMSADPSGFGIHYTPDQSPPQLRLAIKVFGDTGVVGEYVPGRGRAKIIHAAAAALYPLLPRRRPHFLAFIFRTRGVAIRGGGSGSSPASSRRRCSMTCSLRYEPSFESIFLSLVLAR